MVKFRPCCVAYFGHIQSMLPCSLLAKPEFPSLPFAKTSSTMPGIFLESFNGSHSFERFFFFIFLMPAEVFSLWSFIHLKHFLRFSHLDAGASYDEADVRRFFFLYGISTVKGSSGDISCEPLFPAISPADKGWQKNNVSLR